MLQKYKVALSDPVVEWRDVDVEDPQQAGENWAMEVWDCCAADTVYELDVKDPDGNLYFFEVHVTVDVSFRGYEQEPFR